MESFYESQEKRNGICEDTARLPQGDSCVESHFVKHDKALKYITHFHIPMTLFSK